MIVEFVETENELVHAVETSGLEKTKSQKFLDLFTPYFNTMGEIEKQINALLPDDSKLARVIRFKLRDNRLASEEVKDKGKAGLLIEGRLIDNLNNIIKNTSKGLELQCEQIEKAAEIEEAARIDALKTERLELLNPYVEDANIFPLGTMSDDAFNNLLEGSKLAQKAKVEAARLAEEKRLAIEIEIELERERVRQENERLKKEAAEQEKALAAERAVQAAKIAEIEKANKLARDKAAAELKASQDAAAKIAKELQDQKDAEAKAQAAKIAAEKKAAKAPVKEKLIVAINGLKLELPASDITLEIQVKFEGFRKWALSQIESL